MNDRIKTLKDVKKPILQASKEENHYHALTPNSDIQNGQEYMNALDWALGKEDIYNIAVSGPYGSGKSSLIHTFIRKKGIKDVIPISLATFDLEHSPDDQGNNNEKITEELESNILKQLFYSVRAERIPKSRYRKLQPEKLTKNIVIGAIVEFLLLILIYFAFPKQVETFVNSINVLPNILKISLFTFALTAFWYICFVVVRWFEKYGSVQEIKVFDKATLRNKDNNDEESVFDKNMDEIIYFFEETKYKIVIIEDLDRFENTKVFVALRNLNNLINHYEGISWKVTFIYAIKDDMFQKHEERTKFFDFIIPVVPYISSTNSGEILRQQLLFDDKRDKSRQFDISGSFVSYISPYISDMRDLTCICNEFILYKNTLKGNQHLNLNDQQMFSLIVYKNLYPRDFSQLECESDQSIVRQAFLDKQKFISEKESLTRVKQLEMEEIIHKVENETLVNIKELKIVLLMCMMNYNAWVNSITVDGKTYSYSDMLKDDFDIDMLKGKRLQVSCAEPNGYNRRYIDNIEKTVSDNGGNYFERLDRIKQGIESCREEAKKSIEEYEQQMNELHTYSIRHMIEKFGTAFLSENVRANDLVVFLLRNGYIDENYTDYINYFHPNSISKDEMNFILAVRNHKSEMDYMYPIKNVSHVFDRLQDHEFGQKEIFNFTLIDYLLEEKKNSSAEKLFFEQLSDHSPDSMSFIKAYVERGSNLERFFKLLCQKNNRLWDDVCKDTGISLDTRFKYLSLILSCADIEDVVRQNDVSDGNNSLKEFLLSHSDALEKLTSVSDEKQIEVIDELNLVFSNLETANLSESVREYIFENRHFELNEIMLKRLTAWRAPELIEELNVRNYSIIRTLNYISLLDYIDDNFNDYISRLVLGVDSNTNEGIDTVEIILEKLYPDELELALSVLNKEKTVWSNIADCCSTIAEEDDDGYKYQVWNFLLTNNQIECIWNNVELYFGEYGASDTWLEYIIRNVDKLVHSTDIVDVSKNVKDALLYAEFPEEVFKKIISEIRMEPYSDTLNRLNSMKIKVLIAEQLLPFRPEYWVEMDTISPSLRTFYAEENKREFINNLEKISLTVEDINQLLETDKFDDTEKNTILTKADASEITVETAHIIQKATRSVPKEYVVKAWELLSDDKKYELLLNHIDVFSNDEISALLDQLSPEYHQFVERKRHKYSISYSDYNKALLEKLKDHGYITSIEESWNETTANTFNEDRHHMLTGYVKQAR